MDSPSFARHEPSTLRTRGGSSRSPARQRGQSLVEFALVLPLLGLMLFAVIDFGFIFFQTQALCDAAREGARAGALLKSDAQVKTVVKQYAPWLPLQNQDITVTALSLDGLTQYPADSRVTGSRIRVEVAHDLIWLTLLPSMGKRTLPNKVTARAEYCCQQPVAQ